MMSRLLVALLVVAPACDAVSHADAEPNDPEVVVADLVLAVSSTADGGPGAWIDAYHLFETDLEPNLRHRCGRRMVTELEYSFGRLRLALDQGKSAAPVAERLRGQLGQALACLERKPTPG